MAQGPVNATLVATFLRNRKHRSAREMLSCFEIVLTYLEKKNILVIEKNFCYFETEGQEFPKCLRTIGHFSCRTMKG